MSNIDNLLEEKHRCIFDDFIRFKLDHDKHLSDDFKVNEGVYRDKSHNHAMTAFCDLTTVSIEHMQNIASAEYNRVYTAFQDYIQSQICDNFGNI